MCIPRRGASPSFSFVFQSFCRVHNVARWRPDQWQAVSRLRRAYPRSGAYTFSRVKLHSGILIFYQSRPRSLPRDVETSTSNCAQRAISIYDSNSNIYVHVNCQWQIQLKLTNTVTKYYYWQRPSLWINREIPDVNTDRDIFRNKILCNVLRC